MSDVTFETTAKTPLVRVFVVLELYVVAAYVAAAVIPYLWRHHPAPPTWTWIVPGWLLGVPGFGVTLLGPVLAVPLALIGVEMLAWHRRALSTRLRRWCVSATVLMGVYAAFSFTPLARTIATWVAD